LSVVLDANALIVLALDRQRAVAVEELLRVWKAEGEELHAPVLLRYEIASALAQAVSAGQLMSEAVADASQRIGSVPIVLHQLNDTPAVVAMAQRLDRRSAYDAAYVVLAEELGTQLWTLDGRLARNAAARGLPVQLIQTD
jgi:predicted nucleic acid-binding protein